MSGTEMRNQEKEKDVKAKDRNNLEEIRVISPVKDCGESLNFVNDDSISIDRRETIAEPVLEEIEALDGINTSEENSPVNKILNTLSDSSINMHENVIKSDNPLAYSTVSIGARTSHRSYLARLFKTLATAVPFIADPYYDFTSGPKWFFRHPGNAAFDKKSLTENGKKVKILEDKQFEATDIKISKQSKDLGYTLTATYPTMKDPITGRMQLMNYPNADAYFMVGSDEYLFGGLYDGSGSGGVAYYASNVAALEAVNEFMKFKSSFPSAYSSRDLLAFLKNTVLHCHNRLVGIEECGATTLVNYLLVRGSESYCLYYIIIGDVELMRYDSLSKKWESLNQPEKNLRLNTGITHGGIGHGWEDYTGNLLPHTNLYSSYKIVNPNDVILVSSDGLGDAIDPVQNGWPIDIGITKTNKWEEVAARTQDFTALCKKIQKYKNNIISEALEITDESSLKQKTNQLVEYLFFLTSGERDLYLNNPKYSTARKFDKEKIFRKAKTDFNNEKIFGKLDHVGIQLFRPKILETFEYE